MLRLPGEGRAGRDGGSGGGGGGGGRNTTHTDAGGIKAL